MKGKIRVFMLNRYLNPVATELFCVVFQEPFSHGRRSERIVVFAIGQQPDV